MSRLTKLWMKPSSSCPKTPTLNVATAAGTDCRHIIHRVSYVISYSCEQECQSTSWYLSTLKFFRYVNICHSVIFMDEHVFYCFNLLLAKSWRTSKQWKNYPCHYHKQTIIFFNQVPDILVVNWFVIGGPKPLAVLALMVKE